jgi:ribosome maturation factor RimP
MSAIQTDIENTLAEREPRVEVLLAEVVGGKLVRLFIDHPGRRHARPLRARDQAPAEVREQYALEVSSPGAERPLTKPEHFRRFVGRRARVRTRGEHDGRTSFTGELLGATDDAVTVAADTAWCPSPTPTSTVRTSWETEHMSQEIVDAVRALAREKGISEEKLMHALEDALLSAYKKQPGAAAYARVRMDRDSASTASRS